MKTNKRAICSLLLLGIATILSFSSCSKDHDSDGEEMLPNLGYRILAYANSTNVGQGEYLLPFDSLMSGSISPVNYGYDLTGTLPYFGFFYHKGFYYFYQDNQLHKYKVDKTTNQFTKVGGMVFTYFTPAYTPVYWVDDRTLVMIGTKDKAVNYVIVDADNMTATSNGKLDISFYSGPTLRDSSTNAELTPSFNLFFFKVDGNKAVLGYTYDTFPEVPGTTDVNYYAEMDYPSMSNVRINTDARLNYMMAGTGKEATGFKDENGNYYIATSNTYFGATNKKDGLLRINKGESVPDPSYFLEASSLGQNNEFYISTAVYIGNGKAYLGGNGQYNTNLLIDVKEKKVVKNLGDNIPQNSYAFLGKNSAIVENNKLYFTSSNGDKGAIYEYDPATDKLTKGLELNGGVFATGLFHKVEGE